MIEENKRGGDVQAMINELYAVANRYAEAETVTCFQLVAALEVMKTDYALHALKSRLPVPAS